MSDTKVLYERESVCIHTSTLETEERIISGSLKLIKYKDGESFIEWQPHSPLGEDIFTDHDWTLIDATSVPGMNSGPIAKLDSPTQVRPRTYLPPGYVRQTVSRSSSDRLSFTEDIELLSIVNCQPRASDTAVTSDSAHETTGIQFGLAEVESVKIVSSQLKFSYVVFSLLSGETLPSLYFHLGGIKEFRKILQKSMCLSKIKQDDETSIYVVDKSVQTLRQSVHGLNYDEDDAANLTASLFGDAFNGAMGGLSRVTRFIRGALGNKTGLEERRPSSEKEIVEDALLADDTIFDCHSGQNGYEVVVKDPSPEPLTTEQRLTPMTESEWRSYLDTEGRVCDVKLFKARVFAGGLKPELRREVWKFLLDYYDYKATDSERAVHREQKAEEYHTMKRQWSTMSERQLVNFSVLKDRQQLIEKDVQRTDRTLPFFKDGNGRGLVLLNDILMTYGMYNFDLGYVQGMSDLLSPIVIVMDDEVDAFWCFVEFMDRVAGQFAEDQLGMKTQLTQLSTLIRLMMPSFGHYLRENESEKVYFCFRWLLCRFKREFPIENTMRIWEVLWSNHLSEDFHLFLCLGILQNEKDEIMRNKLGFNDILKYINDLAGHIDLEQSLMTAQALYDRFQNMQQVPMSLQGLRYTATSDDSFQSAPVLDWSAGTSSVVAGYT